MPISPAVVASCAGPSPAVVLLAVGCIQWATGSHSRVDVAPLSVGIDPCTARFLCGEGLRRVEGRSNRVSCAVPGLDDLGSSRLVDQQQGRPLAGVGVRESHD